MCQWPNVYCQPAQQYCLVLEVASYNHRVLHSTNNARAAIKQMKVKKMKALRQLYVIESVLLLLHMFYFIVHYRLHY